MVNLKNYLMEKRNSNVNRMLSLTTEMIEKKSNDENVEELKVEYDTLDKELKIVNDVIEICERRGRF